MSAGGATCAVVDLGDGTLGIVTDRDLRTRVLAAGLGGDAPASAAMSAPAYTCRPDRLGGDILLEMLDRGFRHFPVVSATGKILGVIEDLDLVAAYSRSSFFLRQRIGARADDRRSSLRAARDWPTVIAMHDARVAATNIMAVYSVVVDALTRRVLELEVRAAREPSGRLRGWRSAARRGARWCHHRTSTPRSSGSATRTRRRSAPACSRSPPRWSATWRRVGCDPTRTGRARPTRRSCAR